MWERRVAYLVGFILGFMAAISLVSISQVRYKYVPTANPLGVVYKIDRLTGDIYLIAGTSISEVEAVK